MNEPTVCIVDDDEAFRDSLDSFLRSAGFRVRAFASPADFLERGLVVAAAYLLLDVTLPGMSGPEFLGELRRRGVATPVVFLSGHEDDEVARRVLAAGALACLTKPFDEDELLGLLGPGG